MAGLFPSKSFSHCLSFEQFDSKFLKCYGEYLIFQRNFCLQTRLQTLSDRGLGTTFSRFCLGIGEEKKVRIRKWKDIVDNTDISPPRRAEMERFKRLSWIVEETIGLSAMGWKALIKEQVIFQRWLYSLIGHLKIPVWFLTPDSTVVIRLQWQAFWSGASWASLYTPAFRTHTHTPLICKISLPLYDDTKSAIRLAK